MGRINQIRHVILERRGEDREAKISLEDMVARFLAQSIHGAQGNKRGVAGAAKFSRLPKKLKRISRDMARKIGGDLEPAFTPEEIAAEVARQQGETQ